MGPASNTETDEQLLLMARRGDSSALAVLLHRHANAVSAVLQINPKWQSQLTPDDVLQETFRDVLIGFREFDGRSAFATWMTRIAVNNLHDAIRALEAMKRPQPGQQEAEGSGDAVESIWLELTSGMETPSQLLSREQKEDVLKAEIAQLPKDYRDVLTLRWLEGAETALIARRLGRTEGWVRLVDHKARRKLAERLAKLTIFSSFL